MSQQDVLINTSYCHQRIAAERGHLVRIKDLSLFFFLYQRQMYSAGPTFLLKIKKSWENKVCLINSIQPVGYDGQEATQKDDCFSERIGRLS